MSDPTKTQQVMRAADDRLGSGKFLRSQFNKVFPDHWSFMLGEIALYSFLILVLTGTFLTFFFHASEHHVVYEGRYVPLKGVAMSEAYESVLRITFDVRAGLLIRQIHHWAALVFLGAIVVHMCRIFFTGAYRKPREMNWILGITLLMLAILEGFAGYSLPDDLMSGTGLRIAYSIVESVPVVGSWLATFAWDGQYPGHEQFIPRLYIAHVFIVPAIIVVLLSAHLMAVWHQKHTDFPLEGRTERNVVGSRVWPSYAFKSLGLLFLVFGALCLLAGYAQINPIWLYGPYEPSQISTGAQPDWYMWWLEGGLRLMPHVVSTFLGYSIDWAVFIPAVVLPLALFGGFFVFPFVERLLTRDKQPHELLQWPREHPFRTGLGAAVIAFYLVLTVAGANDVTAYTFGLNLNQLTWSLRILAVVLPLIVFLAARAACIRRQRAVAARKSSGDAVVIVAQEDGYGYGLADVAGEPSSMSRK